MRIGSPMASSRTGIRIPAFWCILSLVTCLILAGTASAAPAMRATPDIRVLDPTIADATVSEVTSGSLDARFTGSDFRKPAAQGEVFWLRIHSNSLLEAPVLPVLVVHSGMLHKLKLYVAGSGEALPAAAHI